MLQNLLTGVPAGRTCAGICLVALAVAACGGDGPIDPVSPTASMSFTYSGAESGSFAVTGLSGPSRSGASAVRFDGPPTLLMVSGTQLRTSTHLDFLDFVMPPAAAPKTFSLGDDCGPSTAACPVGAVGIDQPAKFELGNPGAEPDPRFFVFTSGTVTVTMASATRIAGTFEGTAQTLTLQETPRVLTITNGKFDVPLVPLEDLRRASR